MPRILHEVPCLLSFRIPCKNVHFETLALGFDGVAIRHKIPRRNELGFPKRTRPEIHNDPRRSSLLRASGPSLLSLKPRRRFLGGPGLRMEIRRQPLRRNLFRIIPFLLSLPACATKFYFYVHKKAGKPNGLPGLVACAALFLLWLVLLGFLLFRRLISATTSVTHVISPPLRISSQMTFGKERPGTLSSVPRPCVWNSPVLFLLRGLLSRFLLCWFSAFSTCHRSLSCLNGFLAAQCRAIWRYDRTP